MRNLILLSAMIVLFIAPAWADTSFPPANYRFTVYQDQAGSDPTSLFVALNGQALTATLWNVDEEADYYLVPNRNVFGWAHFTNDGTGLHMIGNPVTYGNAGIIVGTTTVIPIPEPSIWELAGIGSCLMAFAAARKIQRAKV